MSEVRTSKASALRFVAIRVVPLVGGCSLVGAACGQPQFNPPVEAARVLIAPAQIEPHAIATHAFERIVNVPGVGVEVIETPDTARVYISGGGGVFASFDGATTFAPPVNWSELGTPGGDGCEDTTARGDTDVLVSNYGNLEPDDIHGFNQVMYASTLAVPHFSFGVLPDRVLVLKSGHSGRISDSTRQCRFVFRPKGTGVMDKTSLAISDGGNDRRLYVAWQDGGTVDSEFQRQRSRIWLQSIPLDASGIMASDLPPPTPIQSPLYHSALLPPVPTYANNCDMPNPGSEFGVYDDVGRGNLWSTSTGDLYITFSNVLGKFPDPKSLYSKDNIKRIRIYVEKLTGVDRFIACIDQFDATAFGSQGHLEEHDPEMVIDEQTGTIAVVYTRPTQSQPEETQRIQIASSALDGRKWLYRQVTPGNGSLGDQTQPAIALTNYTDALDRVFSGTIMVTWYEPYHSTPYYVFRAARGFFPGGDHSWASNTVPLQVSSDPPFYPTDATQPWDSASNRGPLEYQGVTHLPGLSSRLRPDQAVGGWLGVWQQPNKQFANPKDGDQAVEFSRWP